jgi:flagellin
MNVFGLGSNVVRVISDSNRLFMQAQKSVATGTRISSVIDDPQGYVFANSFRSRASIYDAVNDVALQRLSQIEFTNKNIDRLIRLAEEGVDLGRQALAKGSDPRSAVWATAPISEDTPVSGYVIGSQFKIVSDKGGVFAITLDRPGITWGELARGLNAANIGVRADFVPLGAPGGATVLNFYSTNGWDFRFDGSCDQTIMDDLLGPGMVDFATGQALTSPAHANALFGSAGITAAGETGLTVGTGGSIVGTANVTAATPVAAGSSLTLLDADGRLRNLH